MSSVVKTFVVTIVLFLIGCTPMKLLDTIERNPAFTIPRPPKTKQLRLVVALNGNYDMGKAATEKLMAYYRVSDTLEVHEKLTGTISEALSRDHLYLPKTKAWRKLPWCTVTISR